MTEKSKCQHCGSPLDNPLQIKSTLGAWADYICKPCFAKKLKERLRERVDEPKFWAIDPTLAHEEDIEPTPVRHLHRGNPDTSVEAAESIDTTRLEFEVLRAIRKLGPCISDEVRRQFPGAAYSSITARYRALLDKGMIRDTGDRRPGNSGRKQRVMEAL